MTQYLRIAGPTLHDPANHVDGQVRDILVADGKVVAAFPPDVRPGSVTTLNASGLVAMPGGVDIHCHIASGSVNRARAMQGEEHATHVHACADHGGEHLRAGSGVLTPSTFTTGHRYAALGYTTALEAAVSPSGARQTHLELDDTPNLDAGFLLLLANHQRVIELLDANDSASAIAFVADQLRATGALGVKVVNPGGVAAWRVEPKHKIVESIDQTLPGSAVTPRRILQLMADAAEKLNLPHAPHVHCNRLGLPGNVATTLDTLAALDGRRVHLTHLQFHAYGQTAKGDFTSAA
ncbi:MAG: amidohydrolase family protein, partial [Planctomycetota bacterium]|nr:amidohydrolase family protein [Planctomycetota bacterium]